MHVLYANVCNTAMAMPSQASVYASGSCYRGYTAPTMGCMTAVVSSYVEVIPCRMRSCCMTHHENEIDTLMYIMRK
jgi:hypothetical protein